MPRLAGFSFPDHLITYLLCRCFGAPARRVFPDHLIPSLNAKAQPGFHPQRARMAAALRRLFRRDVLLLAGRAASGSAWRGTKPASELEQHIVDWFLPYRERELSPRWIRALRRDLALRWSGSAEHSPGMMDKQTLFAVVTQMRARGAFEGSPAVMEAIRVNADPGAKSAGPMRP